MPCSQYAPLRSEKYLRIVSDMEIGVTISSEKYLKHIRLTLEFIFIFLGKVIYIRMTGHLVPVLCLPNVNPHLLGSNPSYC